MIEGMTESQKEALAVTAATIGVIAAMFLPGIAVGFAAIFVFVRLLNYIHDPRHAKRPPDAP